MVKFKPATRAEADEIHYWLLKQIDLAEYALDKMTGHTVTFSEGEIRDVKLWIRELRTRFSMLHTLTGDFGFAKRTSFLNYWLPHINTLRTMGKFQIERDKWLRENNFRIGFDFQLEKVK